MEKHEITGSIPLLQALSQMPFLKFICNQCRKKFTCQGSVLNHQNQKSSTCWKTYSVLVDNETSSEAERLASPTPLTRQQTSLSPPMSPSLSMPLSLSMLLSLSMPPSSSMSTNVIEVDNVDNQVSKPVVSSQFYTKYFSGASKGFQARRYLYGPF